MDVHNLFEVGKILCLFPRVASELATLGFAAEPLWGKQIQEQSLTFAVFNCF